MLKLPWPNEFETTAQARVHNACARKLVRCVYGCMFHFFFFARVVHARVKYGHVSEMLRSCSVVDTPLLIPSERNFCDIALSKS